MGEGNGSPEQTPPQVIDHQPDDLTKTGRQRRGLLLGGVAAAIGGLLGLNQWQLSRESQSAREAQEKARQEATAQKAKEPQEQMAPSLNSNLPQNRATMDTIMNRPTPIESTPTPTATPTMWERPASTPEPGITPSTFDQRVKAAIDAANAQSK